MVDGTMIFAAVGVLVPFVIFAVLCSVTMTSQAVLYTLYCKSGKEEQAASTSVEEVKQQPAPEPEKKAPSKKLKEASTHLKAQFAHKWLLATLKGHTGEVLGLAFASDGKRLASVSEDENVILWSLKDFEQREHKFSRCSLGLDRATQVAFAPDSKTLLVNLKRENRLAVFRILKRDDSSMYKLQHVESVNFPVTHVQDIKCLGFASNAKFVYSACSEGKAVVYSIKGDVLERLVPRLGGFYGSSLSPDGHFLALCGFSPDVFVYEVKFNAAGEFIHAKKAFNLQGANSGVYAAAFNQDSSRAVTASKDGTWRLYNTDIRFAQGEDAKLITSGKLEELHNTTAPVHITISPSGVSFVIAIGATLFLFAAQDEQPTRINLPSAVGAVQISSCGKLIAVANGRVTHVLRNVAEKRGEVAQLEKSLEGKVADNARRRIQEAIDEAKLELNAFE